jgi:hypothetical protein
MMVTTIALPLLPRPGDLFIHCHQTTPRELRELAHELQESFLDAAKTLAKVTAQGWGHTATIYRIFLEPNVEIASPEEAEQLLESLGIDPRGVWIFDDDEDDLNGENDMDDEDDRDDEDLDDDGLHEDDLDEGDDDESVTSPEDERT